MQNIFKDANISKETLNTDMVKGLCELMHRVAEIDVSILKESNKFHDTILLFHEVLVNIDEKDSNIALVLFFSYLINNRHALEIIDKYLDYITEGLVSTIPREQDGLSLKVADSLMALANKAESFSFEPRLAQAITSALLKPAFSGLSDRAKKLFVQIIMVLKRSRNHIKLALVNYHGILTHVVGEDSLIGLELESQKVMKVLQA